jgi:hypothetical protein
MNARDTKLEQRTQHTIAETEEESFILQVENPVGTGRNPIQSINLTRASFFAAISTSMLYLNSKGLDFEEMLKEATGGDMIEYECSEGDECSEEDDN